MLESLYSPGSGIIFDDDFEDRRNPDLYVINQPQYFRSLLLRPLKNGDPAAGKLLQALVGQILLRRTKDSKDAEGQQIIKLPAIEFFQCPVQLDLDTRKLYDEVRINSVRRFEEALQEGQVCELAW